jgi:hypothetical protein
MLKRWSIFRRTEEDVKHHVFEYLLLLTSGVFFLVFLSIFKGDHTKQFIVVSLFVMYYIFWGIIHHARDQSLHLKVVLEYIFIGAIALFLLRTLLM